MGRPIKYITNQRFGKLLVLNKEENINNRIMWKCICDCGKIKNISSSSLLSCHTISCGCYKKERNIRVFTKHDEASVKNKTKEYRTWLSIKDRCINKKNKNYYLYGGNNISVCNDWKNSYELFLKDIGRAPTKFHSIDRINSNGNYEPKNCRWATILEQARNKRIQLNDKCGIRKLGEERYLARICVNNKRIHLGVFKNIEDAIIARKNAKLKYWK